MKGKRVSEIVIRSKMDMDTERRTDRSRDGEKLQGKEEKFGK